MPAPQTDLAIVFMQHLQESILKSNLEAIFN